MTAVDALAGLVARGEPLSEADASVLLETSDLIAVGMIGDEVRRRLHGSRTTFGRVLEVHVEAIPVSVPPGASFGELRIVGRPESLAAAADAVRRASALRGNAPLTAFSLSDLLALGPIEDVCGRLRDAGLDAVAAVPLDRLEDAAAAVEAARRSGLKVLRLTVESLSPDARIALPARARALQASLGGFIALAPLPRVVPVEQPTTGYDDVKEIAVARAVAGNIPSIQVDWPLYGPKLAQVALTVGADDVDGVAAVDTGALGTRRSPIEEIRGNIRAAALDPVERDGLFREWVQ